MAHVSTATVWTPSGTGMVSSGVHPDGTQAERTPGLRSLCLTEGGALGRGNEGAQQVSLSAHLWGLGLEGFGDERSTWG